MTAHYLHVKLKEIAHTSVHHSGTVESQLCKDAKELQNAKELQVCSHQAAGSDVALANGSLSAFEALWAAGIRCYDMDVTAIRDDMLITHPKRLQASAPIPSSPRV